MLRYSHIYIQGVCICQALKIRFNPVFPYKVLKTLSRSGRKWHLNFWQSKRFVFLLLLLLSVDPEGSSLRKIDVWGRQIYMRVQKFKKTNFNSPLVLISFKKSSLLLIRNCIIHYLHINVIHHLIPANSFETYDWRPLPIWLEGDNPHKYLSVPRPP